MPLTDVERRQIESLLVERRAALLLEIRQDVARSRDDTFSALAGEVHDTGDEASAALLADTENAETSRDLRELRALEQAVSRLAKGSYGICLDCRDDIPFERLRAYLPAARCIRCQGIHERTHTHPPEPRL